MIDVARLLHSVGTVHRKGSNRKEKKWPWIAYCAMFNREEDIYYVRVARLADPQGRPALALKDLLWLTGARCFMNRVADVTHRTNQRRITDFFSQSSDENLHQFRVIFVLVLPNAFTQFSAGKDTARLTH